jgi:hypothetical protein
MLASFGTFVGYQTYYEYNAPEPFDFKKLPE